MIPGLLAQDVALAVFQNTDLETQLYRYTGFSFTVPFGNRLKTREYAFFVEFFPPVQDTPVYLINLTVCMLDKAFYLQDEHGICQAGILNG